MAATAEKTIEIALAEVGYLEKASNSQLDDKTANAGYNNWTKYARDLDKLGNYYNGKKNGYAWCDVFVDWCFYMACDKKADGRALNYQPLKSTGAGCYYSYQFYKAAGKVGTAPKIGAQIFFGSSKSNISHTGLVYKFNDTTVYTIEGNTSSSSGVIANGGAVCKKSYKRTYSQIQGYGYPNYEVETPVEPDKPKPPLPPNKPEVEHIKALQNVLNLQYNLGFVLTGVFGEKTRAALDNHILSTNLVNSKNEYVLWVQKRLVALGFKGTMGTPDGYFGPKTKASVVAFQKARRLEADGKVGSKTAWQLCIDNFK